MTRSTRTVAEFEAAALLLGEGWSYDQWDHSFEKLMTDGYRDLYFDADTMEPIYNAPPPPESFHDWWKERKKQVLGGVIGAADGPIKKNHR